MPSLDPHPNLRFPVPAQAGTTIALCLTHSAVLREAYGAARLADAALPPQGRVLPFP